MCFFFENFSIKWRRRKRITSLVWLFTAVWNTILPRAGASQHILSCIWNIMVIIITWVSFSIRASWVSLSDTYGLPPSCPIVIIFLLFQRELIVYILRIVDIELQIQSALACVVQVIIIIIASVAAAGPAQLMHTLYTPWYCIPLCPFFFLYSIGVRWNFLTVLHLVFHPISYPLLIAIFAFLDFILVDISTNTQQAKSSLTRAQLFLYFPTYSSVCLYPKKLQTLHTRR